MNRKRRAFTLIELLVVIAIIGLLASLVGPKFFGQLKSAKEKTARAQLELFSSALDSFHLDTGRYPTTEEGLKILWAKKANIKGFNGPYLPKKVEADPWGNPYVYKKPGEDGHDYELKSLGADGEVGGSGENKDISIWD